MSVYVYYCESIDCEVVINSQFAINRYSQLKPDLRYSTKLRPPSEMFQNSPHKICSVHARNIQIINFECYLKGLNTSKLTSYMQSMKRFTFLFWHFCLLESLHRFWNALTSLALRALFNTYMHLIGAEQVNNLSPVVYNNNLVCGLYEYYCWYRSTNAVSTQLQQHWLCIS